jgi:serpin B
MNRTALALLLTSACTGSTEPPMVKSDLERNLTPDISASDLATLVADNTAFAADLYRQVHDKPGNLFMSPHSISTALAMTYAGANGPTATQMATALHFTLPPATLHAGFIAIDLALASRAPAAMGNTIPFRLRTANSIWGQEGKAFQAPFLDTLAVNYGTGLHVLDFANAPDASRETINTWVEEQTNDKIVDLLPDGSITGLTRLVLTNAIYFSAAWATPFETGATADRVFHTPTGDADVPTLAQNEEMRYGAGDGYRAAELPYDGGQLGMVVIVPDDLASFEANLTGATLTAVSASLHTAMVDLKLPKFRFDAPLGLKETLQTLGMVDAFEDNADLSGIDGDFDLHVGDVLHKGFVAIDEHGTEAAAATAVIIDTDSAPEPATLTVDRPFVFFIRDIPTGTILFVGRVVDPR